MRGRLPEIRRAGLQLAIVGNGTLEQAQAFQKRYAPDVAVYSDPTLQAYAALGFRRGVGATLGPASAVAFARAYSRGHRQGPIEGDPWQQGGLVLMAPGGRALYVQRNRQAGDRPDVDGALAALVARRPERAAARRRPRLG